MKNGNKSPHPLILEELVRISELLKFQISTLLEALPLSGDEKHQRFVSLLEAVEKTTRERMRLISQQ